MKRTYTVHKFSCKNDPSHVFYLDLDFPQPIAEIGEMLKAVCCPFCQGKDVNFHFTPYFIKVDPPLPFDYTKGE